MEPGMYECEFVVLPYKIMTKSYYLRHMWGRVWPIRVYWDVQAYFHHVRSLAWIVIIAFACVKFHICLCRFSFISADKVFDKKPVGGRLIYVLSLHYCLFSKFFFSEVYPQSPIVTRVVGLAPCNRSRLWIMLVRCTYLDWTRTEITMSILGSCH
jgi:hypothetical protein